MKAITILQPWASLVAHGAKRYETRSWRTNYRGSLAVHAGARFRAEDRCLCEIGFWAECLGIARGDWSALPLGAVLATCVLEECVPTELVCPSEPECFFGNFTHGRWAWRLVNVRRLREPVPARGAQGLWDWEG